MEDPRVHLPVTLTPAVDVAPLPELLAARPGVKLQLLVSLYTGGAAIGVRPLPRVGPPPGG
jgi:hypothetical protein